MNRLLSDRMRPRLLGGALAGIAVSLAIWTWLNLSGRIGYLGLELDPGALDGTEVVLTLVQVGPPVDDGRFVVFQGSQPIQVVGDPSTVRPGEDVTLGGTFSAAEGAVVLAWLEHAPDRGTKKLLGLLTLGFLACAAPFWFRWDRGVAIRG